MNWESSLSPDIWEMLATVFGEGGKGLFSLCLLAWAIASCLFSALVPVFCNYSPALFFLFSSFAIHTTWLLVYLKGGLSSPSNLSMSLALIGGTHVNSHFPFPFSLGTTMSNPDISHKGNVVMCAVL